MTECRYCTRKTYVIHIAYVQTSIRRQNNQSGFTRKHLHPVKGQKIAMRKYMVFEVVTAPGLRFAHHVVSEDWDDMRKLSLHRLSI
jgi:hypothetical protein